MIFANTASHLAILLVIAGASLPGWATAQTDVTDTEVEKPVEIDTARDNITVTGQRIDNTVLGDIIPDLTFDRDDIESFGAGTISELLDALEQELQTGRGRDGSGRPVLLLDGRRISNRREVRAYPTEAIERVDILPEDAAVQYGFRAEQRVVNFVLVDDFHSLTSEIQTEFTSEGGRRDSELELSGLKLDKPGRTSFDFQYRKAAPLLESERDIISEPDSRPYDVIGNFAALDFGDEIDSALSAGLGREITVIGVPNNAVNSDITRDDLINETGSVNQTDIRPFRTLESEIESISANAAHTRQINKKVEATLSLGGDYSKRVRFTGLPEARLSLPADNLLSPFTQDVDLYRLIEIEDGQRRETKIYEGTAAFAVLSQPGRDSWSFTGDYTFRSTETDRQGDLITDAIQAALDSNDAAANPFGDLTQFAGFENSTTRSEVGTGKIKFVTNNLLFSLPAGKVSSTVKIGFETRHQDNETNRNNDIQNVDLARDQGNFQASLYVPLLRSQDNEFPGRLSVNGNIALNELSDFGTLTSYGYGLRWRPIESLRLQASISQDETAPSIEQLGEPSIVTANVRVFDFVNGDTVFVNRLRGGNPNLAAEDRRLISLGANWQISQNPRTSLSLEYTDSQTDNPIRDFPAATAEIEAAFPGRFGRNSDGVLTSLDETPIGFSGEDRKEIRTRLNFRKRLSRGGGRRSGERSRRSENRASSGNRNERRELSRLSRARSGRINLSLTHTWTLEDSLLINAGIPILDFLDGAARSNGRGGAEHRLNVRADYYKNGIGARLTTDWQSGSNVLSGASDGLGKLSFSDLTTVDLRLFVNLGDRRGVKRKYPWLKDTRIRFSIDNIFAERLDVRDETGTVPLSFQPELIDPLGRVFKVSLRKRI